MVGRRVIGLAAALLATTLAAVEPAAGAQVCAARKIAATGAPSSLLFFARSRARAAWIAKVTREPRLGPIYAQWLRARERRVVCRKLDTLKICIAAALPCRKVTATFQSPAVATKPISARPL